MSGKKYRSLHHKLNLNHPWFEQKRHQDIYWYKTKYSAATKYNSVTILGSNRQFKKNISLLISDTHSLDFGVFIFGYLNLHFTMMIHAIYKGIYITGTSKKCFLSLVYIKFGSQDSEPWSRTIHFATSKVSTLRGNFISIQFLVILLF